MGDVIAFVPKPYKYLPCRICGAPVAISFDTWQRIERQVADGTDDGTVQHLSCDPEWS